MCVYTEYGKVGAVIIIHSDLCVYTEYGDGRSGN